MDMHVDQPGNQVLAVAVDAPALKATRNRARGYRYDPIARDRDGHVRLRCVYPVNQGDMVDDNIVGP